MTETERCIERLHWLFDKNSHVNQVVGISQDCDEVLVELTNSDKNFKVTRFLGIYDLLAQICKGIDEADNWRKN